jgi:glycine/D-amino acid oxidase-like deaminating enzyme/nitrite reductase/ring-hydroxylating ferredoxin subunit
MISSGGIGMDKEVHEEDKLTGVPVSYWLASTEDTDYPQAKGEMEVDVAIVGGGITGLTTAYLLRKEGIRVAVIDSNRIAKGVSGHTTAKITSQHSLIYDKMMRKVGEEKAQQYATANQTAIDLVERIIQEFHIECDFKRLPAYVYTEDEEYVQKLQDEVTAAVRLGIPAEYTDRLQLPYRVLGVMRFDNQAQFHPRKYLLALAAAIHGDDCRIFEQSRAVKFFEGDWHTVVMDNGAKIRAKSVVIASHYPFYDLPGLYFTRIYPERSYLMGMYIRGTLPEGMYITAEDPGRSLRTCADGDRELLILGGEHHKTGHGTDMHKHYEILRKFAESNFDVIDIPYRWSAQDYTAMDEIPIVGHLTSGRNRIYLATGFAKWGMSNGTAAAAIITDLIIRGDSPWAPVYDPGRFTPVASAKNFVAENADVAKNYISGKLNIPTKSFDMEKGEAAIMEAGGHKTGVYRDMDGNQHFVSTTCTHIGCELKWNSAELSWDCPCHGSRFTYTGDIIEGPALECIRLLEDL